MLWVFARTMLQLEVSEVLWVVARGLLWHCWGVVGVAGHYWVVSEVLWVVARALLQLEVSGVLWELLGCC